MSVKKGVGIPSFFVSESDPKSSLQLLQNLNLLVEKSRYDHRIPGERKKEAPGLILRGVFIGGWYETTYYIRLLER